MSYTNVSILFKNKVLNTFFLFICAFSAHLTAQNGWRVKVDVDNLISIRNSFSESEDELNIYVFDSEKNSYYGVSVIAFADNWYSFMFPGDFQLLAGDSIPMIDKQELIIEIKEKREKKHSTTFQFDPGPNSILQLEQYSSRNTINKNNVWGTIVDAYKWQDKIGTNVVVRSYIDQITIADILNSTTTTRYLYLYHFHEKENGKMELVRKFTDSYKACEGEIDAGFLFESIELTDINRDTIGEISTIYNLNCSPNDSLPYTTKMLLTTAGEKYMMYAEVNPITIIETPLEPSLNLVLAPYFDRFMRKKIKKYLETFYISNEPDN